jgi:hypothetical protein
VNDWTLRLPDGAELAGPVVDLRDADTSPRAVRRAIRGGCPTRPDRPAVHAPPPTCVHSHVGYLHPNVSIDRRAALAAVGAARGVDTPHDAEFDRVRTSLRELSVPTVDDTELRAARRRAAEAGSETDRLRERVAALRGRVAARRDDGDDDAVAAAEASLSEATRRLSEASTERVAATQRLKALEERARRARDSREKRFRLGDRVGNLRRARRAVLADLVEPDVREARTRLESWVDDRAIEIDGGLRDALAIATTAPLRAPVVVDPEVVAGLGGPDAAFEWLSAPLAIG